MYLEFKNLKISYEKHNVIKDFNLNINKGEIISIIGKNGTGKSTILKSIIKILKIEEGQINLEKKNIKDYKLKELAKKIAFMSQQKRTYSSLKVKTLVSYGRYPHLKFGKFLSNHDKDIIDDSLKKTGIFHLKDKYVTKLSGGELQRAWIAMAICQEPEILILDEPTTYLDIAYQIELLELIKELNQKLKMTIIMVLHDINLASRYSNKIYALKNKKIHAGGEVLEVINLKTLKEVFDINGKIYYDQENKCPFFIPQK